MPDRSESGRSAAFFIFVFIIGALSPLSAHAQQRVSALTDEIIKDFVLKTAEITAGTLDAAETEEAVRYLDHHLHDQAYFKSAMTYKIPGYPAQENSLSLNKQEFIDNVEKGAQSIDNYENDIRVRNIKISRDGRKATFQTDTSESGTMTVPVNGGAPEPVPVRGRSRCNQIVMLNEHNVIQMYSANCDTEINFLPY